MPELPEVEVIRRGLVDRILGKAIGDINLISPAVIKYPSASQFSERVTGAKIEGIDRRGKYLIIQLNTGEEVVIHLKLTGQLIYEGRTKPVEPYAQVVFLLEGAEDLRFLDRRRLGEIHLVPAGDYSRISGLMELGLEPLANDFMLEQFQGIVGGRGMKIKALLMEQSIIAGIGNAYSNEALFLAGIHPDRPAKSLSQNEIQKLYEKIKEVLQAAISKGGEYAEDFVNVEGKRGSYMMVIHGREGEPCQNCNTPIKRKQIGGRSAYFCPYCQK